MAARLFLFDRLSADSWPMPSHWVRRGRAVSAQEPQGAPRDGRVCRAGRQLRAVRYTPPGTGRLAGPHWAPAGQQALAFWVFGKRFWTQRPGGDPTLKCPKGRRGRPPLALARVEAAPAPNVFGDWRAVQPTDVEKGDLSKSESMHICDTKFLSPTDVPSQSLKMLKSSREHIRPAA